MLLPLKPEARGTLLFLSILLAALAVSMRLSGDLAALFVALWAGYFAYALALTFATVVLPRYLAPLDVLLWISNAISAISLSEQLIARRRRAAVPNVS